MPGFGPIVLNLIRLVVIPSVGHRARDLAPWVSDHLRRRAPRIRFSLGSPSLPQLSGSEKYITDRSAVARGPCDGPAWTGGEGLELGPEGGVPLLPRDNEAEPF